LAQQAEAANDQLIAEINEHQRLLKEVELEKSLVGLPSPKHTLNLPTDQTSLKKQLILDCLAKMAAADNFAEGKRRQ